MLRGYRSFLSLHGAQFGGTMRGYSLGFEFKSSGLEWMVRTLPFCCRTSVQPDGMKEKDV